MSRDRQTEDDQTTATLNVLFGHGHLIFFYQRASVLESINQAVDKYDTADVRQFQSGNYKPTKRGRSVAALTKTWLLQRLFYKETEEKEKEQEEPNANIILTLEDVFIRIAKHTARIILWWPSTFFATLVICRVLHDYDFYETKVIYECLIQNDPKKLKSPYQYREVKQTAMGRCRGRFRKLRIVPGKDREDRFVCLKSDEAAAKRFAEYLDHFKPWNTKCVTWPDVANGQVAELSPAQPDKNQLELNRIHVLFCGTCFSSLTRLLGLPSPNERLTIPELFLSQNHWLEEKPAWERHPIPALTEEELGALRTALNRSRSYAYK